jgi:hypothetical protein
VIGPANNSDIQDGVIAWLEFTVIGDQKDNILTIQGCPSAASSTAAPVYIESTNGAVTIQHLWGNCNTADVVGYGPGVYMDEVQEAINEFLGESPYNYCYDRDMTNYYITIDDVQLVINNFLGIPETPVTSATLKAAAKEINKVSADVTFGGAVSVTAGQTVRLPIVFSGAAAKVSAIAADIVYDPKLLGSPALTLGPKGEAAGKDVFSANLGHGKMRIGVAGINADTLSDGVIAYLSFTALPNSGGKTANVSYVSSATTASAKPFNLHKPSKTSKITILKNKKKK